MDLSAIFKTKRGHRIRDSLKQRALHWRYLLHLRHPLPRVALRWAANTGGKISPRTDSPRFAVLWARSINLGDDVQTLAAMQALGKLGIEGYDSVERESLPSYQGPPVALVMNGFFQHPHFPVAPQITPIFIGFHASSPEIIDEHRDYFKQHEPIGCRDYSTMFDLLRNNVDAYFTGCLSQSFDHYTGPKNDKTYIVDLPVGTDTGRYYSPAIDMDPTRHWPDAEYVAHDLHPEAFVDVELARRLELMGALLQKYREAKLVVTCRLHCALPCRAFGTDTVFLNGLYRSDRRFFGLHKYLRGDAANIAACEKAISRKLVDRQRKLLLAILGYRLAEVADVHRTEQVSEIVPG